MEGAAPGTTARPEGVAWGAVGIVWGADSRRGGPELRRRPANGLLPSSHLRGKRLINTGDVVRYPDSFH